MRFFLHQIYFLQLENYELGRFWKLIPKSYTLGAMRQNTVWTPKLIAVCAISFLLEIFVAAVLALVYGATLVSALVFTVVAFLVFALFLNFVFLSLAVLVLAPIDALAKKRIIRDAQAKLKAHGNLKIIAIAGSYGKTTIKEVLAAVVSQKYKTLMTPGNMNTPLGISRTVLTELTDDTEVFVMELGEHYPGDLAYLTKLFPPDIVLITGIGEAHLERFGTIDALTAGIFEAVEGAKKDALIVLNADNALITENFKSHLGGREAVFYTSATSKRSFYRVHDEIFHEDGSGISFSLARGERELGQFSISLLGEYAIGVTVAAVIVGDRLGLAPSDIHKGLEKVGPVPHRLQVVPSINGVLVIDDSYNGNPEGVRYAIEALGRFTKRRKVYITPGLVEAGEKGEEIHRTIGQQLAGVADIVVLIRNSVTPYIVEGLEGAGFAKENIHWYNSAVEAHAAIPIIIKTGDVVLFQNDWPDNYV